ncbi:MAG: hypothetical protein GX647_09500 [Clostridiales bacterium]|jgi:xylulokinase|nr:hypothetical protein [Clostridiales bacterium]OPZ69299.1 MAG: Xylulose kinase [Firmicutes bacterium ADurb.Bin467]
MASERDLILTLDAGTSGLKCNLFNARGEAVRTVRRAYGTEYPRHNWAEQDPNVILENVFSAIREALEQVGARRIACVGLSGHMNGCIPVDADGNALHPNIIHADARSEKQVRAIAKVIDPAEFYRLTGNRLDAHYTLPKMLWFKENLPDVYKRTRWWLNTKDYVYGHLTGRFGQTDYSDAALTIAMDINRKVWAEELIRSLGLSMEQMPKILVGHDMRGQTTRDVYRKTGLIAGTPVAIGGGDAACTARGAGVYEPGSSYTYIGSSAWVSQLMKRPVLDPQARIFNFLDMDGESCHICGTVQCGAAAFDWARANLLGCAEPKDMADISRIENMARQSRPGAEGVMFLPTLMGSRTPYWDANTRGILMGFTLYHDRKHIARAVYEGVAYALNSCKEIIAECASPMKSMMLTGGGARSGLWPDILAALFGLPVDVHQTPGETTSLGAAITAGVGIGMFRSYEDAASVVRTRSRHPVNPAWRDAYLRFYPIYAELYEKMRPVTDALAAQGI